MNVHLVGAVGGGNFGDEFILNCCIEEYHKLKKTSISFSGFDDKFILRNDQNMHDFGLNFFNILKELRDEYSSENPITLELLKSKLDGFKKCDIVHFMGGGYINSLWPSNYALLAIAYIYSKINSIPIFATGLGLYPYTEDLNIISLLKSLSVIDVRDKESKKLLPDAYYTGDDALLSFYNTAFTSKKDDSAAFIVSLQSHLFDGAKLIEKILSEKLIINLKNKGFKKIIIIEAAPEDNIAFSRHIFNLALNIGIEIIFLSNSDIITNGLPYNKRNFVVSSRYHINLLYSILDIDGLAVYQNDYYRNKHESIIDMGGCWDLVSHEQLENSLNYWITTPKTKKSANMKPMADAKKNLFSKIIANAPSKTESSFSVESALALVNEYIAK